MSFIRKGILASSGSVFCAVIGLIINIIMSRTLQPEGMGRYQIPFTAGTIAITLLSFGIGQSNIYFLNRHKESVSQIITNSFYISIICTLLLLIFQTAVFKIFSSYFGNLSILTITLFTLGMSALYCTNLVRPILIALLKIRESVYVQTHTSIAFLAMIIIFYFIKIISVETALIASAMSSFIGFILNLYYLSGEIEWYKQFDFDLFYKTLKYGLQLFIANLVYVVNVSIGLMLLRYIIPNDFAKIGYYSRATAICNLIMLLPMALGPILYAKWSSVSGPERNWQVAITMRLHFAIGVLMAIGLSITAPLVITILFGKAFLPATMAMRILTISVVCRSIFNICYSLMAGDGKAYVTAYIFLGTLILMIVLSFLLVPSFGINGIAIADVISNASALFAGIWFIRYSNNIHFKEIFVINREDIRYVMSAIRSK